MPAGRFCQVAERFAIEPVSGSLVGRVTAVVGNRIEVEGLERHAPLGAYITVRNRLGQDAPAEVIAVGRGSCSAMLFDHVGGIRLGDNVTMHFPATPHSVNISDDWLGRAVGPRGNPIDGKGPMIRGREACPIVATPPSAAERLPLGGPIELGVRCLDLFTPCIEGQRMGLFAGSGVGKSSLVTMIAVSTKCDVVVIALIGERGREVSEIINNYKLNKRSENAIFVVATSDMSSLYKRDAAHLAMSVAEFFRDKGLSVILLFDNVSRYCYALRDIALTAGSLPSNRGYPPEVFSALPLFLERAGPGLSSISNSGYVTAIFNVLLESDDENDPIADAIRGILDGHIFLDRTMAQRGQYPAVNVLRSLSRCAERRYSSTDSLTIKAARRAIALYESAEDSIRMGFYRPGVDSDLDAAVRISPKITDFLVQPTDEVSSYYSDINSIADLIGKG